VGSEAFLEQLQRDQVELPLQFRGRLEGDQAELPWTVQRRQVELTLHQLDRLEGASPSQLAC
jgi:hypothetical protein